MLRWERDERIGQLGERKTEYLFVVFSRTYLQLYMFYFLLSLVSAGCHEL